MVELALVVPLLLILVFAIVAFGALYEDKIAMNNAARDGARWASQYPNSWSNSASPSSNTIQGQIQGESGTSMIPNLNANINISYYTVDYLTDPPNPVVTYCGWYDQSTDSLVYPGGSSDLNTTPFANTNGCLAEGSLIKVTVTHTFPLPVPIISALFPGGVSLQASATMTEEALPS